MDLFGKLESAGGGMIYITLADYKDLWLKERKKNKKMNERAMEALAEKDFELNKAKSEMWAMMKSRDEAESESRKLKQEKSFLRIEKRDLERDLRHLENTLEEYQVIHNKYSEDNNILRAKIIAIGGGIL